MNSLKEFMMWLAGPVGIGVLGALWGFYAKIRDDAVKRRRDTQNDHEKLTAAIKGVQASVDAFGEDLRSAQREIDMLRTERDCLFKENVQLKAKLTPCKSVDATA